MRILIKLFNVTYLDQLVAQLLAEHSRIVPLHILDASLYFGSGHSRLAAANHAGSDGAGLLVAIQDLGHATVRHSQLPGYDAWPDPGCCKLHDLQPYVIWQWTSIDENTAELVHTPLSCNEKKN